MFFFVLFCFFFFFCFFKKSWIKKQERHGPQLAHLSEIAIAYFTLMNEAFLFMVVFNPLKPSGLFYLTSLDMWISYIRSIWLVFIVIIFCRNTYIRVLWRLIWVYTVYPVLIEPPTEKGRSLMVQAH